MSLPINDRIDPEALYFILLNGEALIPEYTDMFMDYWTAETVCDFIHAISPTYALSIEQAVFVEDTPKTIKKRANWEVLT